MLSAASGRVFTLRYTYESDFLRLFGFGVEHVNYDEEVNPQSTRTYDEANRPFFRLDYVGMRICIG
jgi:hypothetical protein